MHRRDSGFTLIEVLLVVVILAILASAYIIGVSEPDRRTRQTTFVRDLKSFVTAARLFRSRAGEYPEEADAGVMPKGWEEYIDEATWSQDTPIGGKWDVANGAYGVSAALGVEFTADPPEDAFMSELDAKLDDGDLGNGVFRKFAAGRFYFVLEE